MQMRGFFYKLHPKYEYLYQINKLMNIVLFDGFCNLCSSTVLFLHKYDRHNKLFFVAQQHQSGKKIMQEYGINENANSVVFINNKKVYYQSDAVIEIARQLTGWPHIFRYSYVVPKFLRNGVYTLIAKNRYQIFGKKTTCFMPSEAIQKKFL